MSLQVPQYIRDLVPYVPGKPIEETQREFQIKRVIKLASNESPRGASPLAKKAIVAHLKQVHRYPDGSGFLMKKAISEHLGVSPQSLILGNGSNEIIDFLVRTFCLAGDMIAVPRASFIAYKICAQIHGVETLETAVDKNFQVDIQDLVQQVKKNERVRLVFLANPNNPTGTYLPEAQLKSLLQQIQAIRNGSVLVVLDYAYWEYVTASDLSEPLEIVRKFSNVMVLRTFSKIYGLAGIRAGYAVAPAEIVAHLEKVRQPFNLNSLALAGATAALADVEFVRKSQKLNRRGMVLWEKALSEMGIPFWKSQGNFILVDVFRGLGMSGMDVYQACLRKGVIFRPLLNYGLPKVLRISLGTTEENHFAIKVLGNLK